MNIITKTAFANFKKNRSRNILIGIAIGLTTMLLTVVPIAIFGMMDIQFGAVNHIYPTFHAMYRDVPEAKAEEMQEDSQLKDVGLRQDPGIIVSDNANISMMFVDEMTVKSGKMELSEGKLPEQEDEIVVTQGLLKQIGATGAIGDKITVSYQLFENEQLGFEKEKEFTICGMYQDTKESVENKRYSAYVSKAFVEKAVPTGERTYRVYFQVNVSQNESTDAIEARVKEVAKDYGLTEDDVLENAEYLSANYVDPSLNTGAAAVMLVIVLAGMLTIYSIYYVSMMDKVQEFGRLRAIGATKKQIRKLIFREGFTVAAIAIPVGLVLGCVTALFVLKGLVASGIRTENMMASAMKEVLAEKGIALIHPWILLMATIVSLLTIWISLLRPMQVASKISAVEALRFQGGDKREKKARKNRKGYVEMNTRKLTASNLGRNRKRTAVTILTLGVTGIFFMVMATVLSCMNPSVMARNEVRGEIQIELESEEGNKEHPELELRSIQKNNPLNEELKAQLSAIDGVEKIEAEKMAWAGLEEFKEEDGRPCATSVTGYDVNVIKEMGAYVVDGDLDSPKLKDGRGIILGDGFLQKYAGLQVGDKVTLHIEDGEGTVTKEFEIVASVDAPGTTGGYGFTLPSNVLQSLCKNNNTYSYSIFADKKAIEEVTKEVKNLVQGQELLEIDTYEEQYQIAEKQIGYMMYGIYGMLLIFGLIGILNLINTMINSVHMRRREIGIMQAIGLSNKQNIKMLQMEGMFYTAGTLILSLGVGSLAGYGCFLYAKDNGIMGLKVYSYPTVPAVILVAVIIVVQLLIAYLVNKNMKKESLIERIRYAD